MVKKLGFLALLALTCEIQCMDLQKPLQTLQQNLQQLLNILNIKPSKIVTPPPPHVTPPPPVVIPTGNAATTIQGRINKAADDYIKKTQVFLNQIQAAQKISLDDFKSLAQAIITRTKNLNNLLEEAKKLKTVKPFSGMAFDKVAIVIHDAINNFLEEAIKPQFSQNNEDLKKDFYDLYGTVNHLFAFSQSQNPALKASDLAYDFIGTFEKLNNNLQSASRVPEEKDKPERIEELNNVLQDFQSAMLELSSLIGSLRKVVPLKLHISKNYLERLRSNLYILSKSFKSFNKNYAAAREEAESFWSKAHYTSTGDSILDALDNKVKILNNYIEQYKELNGKLQPAQK